MTEQGAPDQSAKPDFSQADIPTEGKRSDRPADPEHHIHCILLHPHTVPCVGATGEVRSVPSHSRCTRGSLHEGHCEDAAGVRWYVDSRHLRKIGVMPVRTDAIRIPIRTNEERQGATETTTNVDDGGDPAVPAGDGSGSAPVAQVGSGAPGAPDAGEPAPSKPLDPRRPPHCRETALMGCIYSPDHRTDHSFQRTLTLTPVGVETHQILSRTALQVMEAQAQAEEARKLATKLEQELAQAQRTLATRDRDIVQYQDRVARLSDSISYAREQNTELRRQLDGEDMSLLVTNLKRRESEQNQALVSANTQVAQEYARRCTAEREVEKLTKACMSHRERMDSLEQRVQDLNATKGEAERRLRQATDLLATEKASHMACDTHVKQQANRIVDLEAQLRQATEARDSIKAVADDAAKRLEMANRGLRLAIVRMGDATNDEAIPKPQREILANAIGSVRVIAGLRAGQYTPDVADGVGAIADATEKRLAAETAAALAQKALAAERDRVRGLDGKIRVLESDKKRINDRWIEQSQRLLDVRVELGATKAALDAERGRVRDLSRQCKELRRRLNLYLYAVAMGWDEDTLCREYLEPQGEAQDQTERDEHTDGFGG